MNCSRRERCATPRYPTGAQAQIDTETLPDEELAKA
tara:strand:- start:80 stop:187 length:108 start_codon:yes stop_codon:yes gene_type:complete